MIDCKRLLVIAAHPDDEVLGCGGTLARLASEGVETHVALLADGVGSRYGTRQRSEAATLPAELEARRAAAREAARLLGVRSVSFGDFPDNRMDAVPLLDIIQKIESLIDATRPDTVFTGAGAHAARLAVDAVLSRRPMNDVLRYLEAMAAVGMGRQISAVLVPPC